VEVVAMEALILKNHLQHLVEVVVTVVTTQPQVR
jgi:hypothetical protein